MLDSIVDDCLKLIERHILHCAPQPVVGDLKSKRLIERMMCKGGNLYIIVSVNAERLGK